MAGLMVDAMNRLPIGYGFRPTDEELLSHYLKRKNLGLQEEFCVVPQIDICSWEPGELRAKFSELSIVESGDPECWFFCEHPDRPKRSTRGGYWKITGPTLNLKSRHAEQIIGSKKFLTYYQGKSPNSIKTAWVMHEYHLSNSALDGLFRSNRKNYVLCMIKNKEDEMPVPDSSYGLRENGSVLDIAEQLFERETEDHSISEHLVQERIEALWRTLNDNVNTNRQPVLPHRMEYPVDLGDVSNARFSPERELNAVDYPSSFSDDSMSVTDFFNEDDDIFETVWPQEQQAMVMENKQMQKVESLQGFIPIDKKKGVIEDNFTRTPAVVASSIRAEMPKGRASPKYMPVVASSIRAEMPKRPASPKYMPPPATGQIRAPSKIKEVASSVGSSSTSIPKPKAPEKQMEQGQIKIVAAPSNGRNTSAPTATTKKQTSSPLTDCRRKGSCGDSSSMVYIRNVLVGMLLFIAIFCEIFNL